MGTLLDQLQPRLARNARDALRLVDATTIRLLALSRWARFGAHHNAAKLHVVYDPDAAVPTFFEITRAHVNDLAVAKAMPIEAGATYVFDKGYYDFAFRAKRRRRRSLRDPAQGQHAACSDRDAAPDRSGDPGRCRRAAARAPRAQPEDAQPVRVVTVVRDDGQTLDLLTHDLETEASTIAALDKARWQVELFFRWVKQNLKIKRFLGTSEHAVKLQILTALVAYLLLRLAKARLPGAASLHHLARRVKLNLMHRKTLPDLLRPPPAVASGPPSHQLRMAFAHVHG